MELLGYRLFEGELAQVPRVRAYVREALGEQSPWTADVETVAGELAANAVQYTPSGEPGGKFGVGIEQDGIRVVLWVHDAGGETVPHIAPDATAEHGELAAILMDRGRGLVLVDVFSEAWGYVDGPSGRSVWAGFNLRDASAGDRRWAVGASPPKVLVLTHWFDPTADSVVRALVTRGAEVFRCDAADFPSRLMMEGELGEYGWGGSLQNEHRSVDLADVVGAYYRRPSRFSFPDGMSGEERSWAAAEARYGFGGLLSAILPWLNHPAAIARAEYKPAQLQMATRSGLCVPDTLVTNDPDAARRFADSRGSEVVYKSLSGELVSEEDNFKAIYTTPVVCGDHGYTGVALTAHLFQQQIVDKAYDVRLTVVGGRLFAAAIYKATGRAALDWRRDYAGLMYAPIDVPSEVANGVQRLMRMLDLRFGALDFAVTASGRWWFLEVNPNGQWGWVEDATNLPITAAIADELIGGNQ